MHWSPRVLSIWGKLDADSGEWMPLVRHLEDTAGVAGHLWDEYLSQATRTLIREAGRCASDGEARCLAVWLASVHDIGKASPAFAAKATWAMPALLDVMRDQGLDARPRPEDSVAPHATVGQYAIGKWLQGRCPDSSKQTRTTYACVIGCHHGTTPTRNALRSLDSRPDLVGQGPWSEVRDEVLESFAVLTGADQFLHRWMTEPLPLHGQVLLTGFVIMADWIASNTVFFPLSWDVSGDQRLDRAMDLLDLPEPWVPRVPAESIDAQFAARFPALGDVHPRPLQRALVDAAWRIPRPGLFVVEGPMGGGKTEAALLAAEVLAERFGMGGVFVGLPTMATANPMFSRVRDWLATALNGADASISLAHGKAALNDDYASLLRQPWSGAVYDEDSDADSWRPAVVVNGWLRGRKRAGLADFVVGTIDQSLFAALKAKHVVLRHLGLAGKVVIIDEVHAADEYMRVYLRVLLEWLGSYRVPVILMSATLPPDRRDEFLNAYSSGVDRDAIRRATRHTDEYPRISVTTGDDVLSVEVPSSDERVSEIELIRIDDDAGSLVSLLSEALVDGGCVGVICNTVARAQDVFRVLHDAFADDVLLVHSRFIAPERARREAELVRMLGPGVVDRPRRLIVVGTQVLEQSLDVDFDLLVTDLAPIDLVLQRAGRLHRHDRPHRPSAVAGPQVWLRGVEDWTATLPIAVRGSRAVYRMNKLLRSAAVLADREVIRLPEQIPSLVRQGYGQELPVPAGWEEAWLQSDQDESAADARSVGRARAYLMPGPSSQRDLNGLIDVQAGDPESSEERGASQVRDSEDGLEVVVLCRDESGALRLPECAPHFPGRLVPQGVEWGSRDEAEIARDMAACTLRLPLSLTNPSVIDAVIAELERGIDHSSWQRSPWISGQLVLVLDSSGCCRLAGHHLTYDSGQGLQVATEKELHQ